MRIKSVIDKIINIALGQTFFDSRKRIDGKFAPGALIKSLSDEEREVLKNATSKDFNHRKDLFKYI